VPHELREVLAVASFESGVRVVVEQETGPATSLPGRREVLPKTFAPLTDAPSLWPTTRYRSAVPTWLGAPQRGCRPEMGKPRAAKPSPALYFGDVLIILPSA
jgi:hypothetical protein